MRGETYWRMNYEEIDKARRLMGLGSDATLSDVKEAYRRLAKEHHPDRKGNAENFAGIQEAYDLIMAYIQSYRYSFTQDEVRRQCPEDAWEKNYESDPIWGRKRK